MSAAAAKVQRLRPDQGPDVRAALEAVVGKRAIASLESTIGADLMWSLEHQLLLKNGGFYGKLVLSFERGAVVNGRQEENLKPPR